MTFADATADVIRGAPAPEPEVRATTQTAGITLFDADGDGDLNGVLASASGVRFYVNDSGVFTDASDADGLRTISTPVTATVAADYDNDDRADLLLLIGAGLRLMHRAPIAATRT